MPALVLVGLPGTGKTTLARALADTWHRDYRDTDDVLAAHVGVPAAQFLRDEGEPSFRKRELDALRAVLDDRRDVVVATGGGIVCSSEARAVLAEQFTLWLDCDDGVILDRLGDVDRPLLGDRPADTLAQLRRERSEWYRSVARARVDTSTSIDDAVARVTREVDRLTR